MVPAYAVYLFGLNYGESEVISNIGHWLSLATKF